MRCQVRNDCVERALSGVEHQDRGDDENDEEGHCDDVCFFFFQAEDGIRDLTVTGVQTCALPISSISLSGPMLYAVHASRPVRRSSPFTQPWMPNSPPDAPTITRRFTMNGATGVVSPCDRSAIFVCHSSLPVAVSIATVRPSNRL